MICNLYKNKLAIVQKKNLTVVYEVLIKPGNANIYNPPPPKQQQKSGIKQDIRLF